MSFLSQDSAIQVLRFVDVRTLSRAGRVCKQWKEHADFISQFPHWITACSSKTDFEAAIQEVFSKCSAPAFRPNVAFLFVSDTYRSSKKEEIIEAELAKLPPLHLVGCTGSGIVGYDHEQNRPVEIETGMAVSLALAHIPSAYIDSFCVTDDEGIEAMVEAVSGRVKDARRCVNFVVLADAKMYDSHDRLKTLVRTLDAKFPQSEVTGGVASGAGRSGSRVLWGAKGGKDGEAMQRFAEKKGAEERTGVVFEKAACLVVAMVTADSAVPPQGSEPAPLTYATVARSFSAVGPAFAVDTVEGNEIQTVKVRGEDGEPQGEAMLPALALRTVAETMGSNMRGLVCGIADGKQPNSSQLRMTEGGITRDGTFELELEGGEAPPAVGMTLQFMSNGNPSDMEACVHEQLRWTQALMSSKPGFGNRVVADGRAEAKSTVRGALLFACCARGSGCYGRPNVDSEAFQAAMPSSAGLCGFFCDGEIGPTHLGSTQTQLYGFTSVYTLFEGV